jgi:hypothetical protein
MKSLAQRIEDRKKRLKSLGVPGTLYCTIDMTSGLMYAHLYTNPPKRAVAGTETDVYPNVNVDTNERGDPIGIEDISSDMEKMVAKWLDAIEIVSKRNGSALKPSKVSKAKTKAKSGAKGQKRVSVIDERFVPHYPALSLMLILECGHEVKGPWTRRRPKTAVCKECSK